ncbi:hypothetical protein PIB30_064506 [Stylosanthes scabra]|uniref:Uncharacterized protein n=1 Tax=Stylosanthes scabra TaxID=79078 RepID=A0ABU6XM37_9FABA|nr:hypothetical protein [Stylosanthes scabra]
MGAIGSHVGCETFQVACTTIEISRVACATYHVVHATSTLAASIISRDQELRAQHSCCVRNEPNSSKHPFRPHLLRAQHLWQAKEKHRQKHHPLEPVVQPLNNNLRLKFNCMKPPHMWKELSPLKREKSFMSIPSTFLK